MTSDMMELLKKRLGDQGTTVFVNYDRMINVLGDDVGLRFDPMTESQVVEMFTSTTQAYLDCSNAENGLTTVTQVRRLAFNAGIQVSRIDHAKFAHVAQLAMTILVREKTEGVTGLNCWFVRRTDVEL